MNLEWTPSAAGETVTKKASNKGEVIFPGNLVKCQCGGGESAKIKLSVPTMPNLEPFLIDVKTLQCNRVVRVTVELSYVVAKATDGKGSCPNYDHKSGRPWAR